MIRDKCWVYRICAVVLVVYVTGVAPLARADLPIHALSSDVLGLWRILETATLHDEFQTCGSTLPNRNTENLRLGDYRRYLEGVYGDLREHVLELVDERYHRRSEVPPRNQWRYLAVRDPASGQGSIGRWTMVYDEGLDIDIGATRYFGFFKYTKIDSSDCPMVMDGKRAQAWPESFPGSQEDSNGKVACYRTKASEIGLGWVTHRVFKNGKPTYLYGCFYAEKVKREQRHSYVLDESAAATFGRVKPSSNLWVKKSYTQFTDLSPFRFLQLHKGVAFKSIHHSRMSGGSARDAPLLRRFMQTDVHSNDYYRELALPRQWSWGDSFNGETDDIQPFSQGQCGSCYAMASIYVLAKRSEILLRKLYPDKDWSAFPRPSVQDIVECSPFGQGCFGGFPFLVGKHLTELGVLDESASPYKMYGDTAPTCSAPRENPEHRLFAATYGYVGGCYECTTELEIMREVYHHGPVAVAIDAPQSLFSYNSGTSTLPAPAFAAGVYDDEPENHGSTCDLPLSGLNGALAHCAAHIPAGWEYTNHAIAIVGWGEEDIGGTPTKFWVCRNTWGNNWGVGGFFKIKRGVNLCGVESQAVYIDPDLTRGVAAELLKGKEALGVAEYPPAVHFERTPINHPLSVGVQQVEYDVDHLPVFRVDDEHEIPLGHLEVDAVRALVPAQREVEKPSAHVLVFVDGRVVEGVVLPEGILQIVLDGAQLVDEVVGDGFDRVLELSLLRQLQSGQHVLQRVLVDVVLVGYLCGQAFDVVHALCDNFDIELLAIREAAFDEHLPRSQQQDQLVEPEEPFVDAPQSFERVIRVDVVMGQQAARLFPRA
ncbi:preprocathepsin c precursor, putative [Babesia caballi]|uniref:Dipeptidyl peptidase 1 n=1 Tax=Babesia caballi TaxID=5871 RepID=A0AAV4LQ30_BABCB|nr:preprocathepsin c precursor, putative [Babesia caballi]